MRTMALTVTLLICFLLSACETTKVKCGTSTAYNGPAIYPKPNITPIEESKFVSTFDQSTQLRLNAALDKAMSATQAESMTVAIGVSSGGLWTARRTKNDETVSKPLHFWASAGKTLTAVTVLKFVEDGKLSLSDPISNFIDNIPNGDLITIEMLLNHTSGLFSVNEDALVQERQANLSLDETIEVLDRHGPLFCPGGNWRYTNTGYALLGYALEKIDGRPFHDIVTATIINPLDLQNIRVLRSNDLAEDVMPLHSKDPNIPPMNIGTGGAAAPMAASSESVILLWQAVLNGRILKQDTVQSMYKILYPIFGKPPYYGLGVMIYEVPEPNGKVNIWVGHSGGAPGVKAVFAYVPSQHAFVAVALSGDGSAEATAYLLLKALDETQGK